LWSFFIFGKN